MHGAGAAGARDREGCGGCADVGSAARCSATQIALAVALGPATEIGLASMGLLVQPLPLLAA